MSQYDTMFDLQINVGHCDIYFMVQWFCFISWRLFDVWTSYFRIMSHYDQSFDLKINVDHCGLYFMVHWFCFISLTSIRCMNIILWDYESVCHDIWPQNKCRSLWLIFHGPMILSYVLKIIWYMSTILYGIMSQYDPMFDLKINVGHCDLYFMVQWFCLISWRLMYEHHTSGLWVSMIWHLTTK